MHEEILALLQELEARARSTPAVGEEWLEARQAFCGADPGPGALARFREWFLLERESPALGSPPVQVWAPADVIAGSAWAGLLDNLLGFYCRESDDASPLRLEDIWRGRSLLVTGMDPRAFSGAGSVAVGRFVPVDASHHAPLPGVVVLEVPGILPALRRDLAAIRSAGPRRRLSQEAVERLLEPLQARSGAAERAALLAELREALRQHQDWDVGRCLAMLRAEGSGATLDRLAFETRADLDRLRRILPRLESLGQPMPRPEAPAAAPRLDPAAAVARFESGRDQGRPLDALFSELEAAFGLEPGSTREPEPGSAGGPVGGAAPGIHVWAEAFAWEREHAAPGQPDHDAATLEAFVEFLAADAGQGLELRRLTGAHVMAFLRRCPDGQAARRSLDGLRPFLLWAFDAQEAPLEAFLARDEAWVRRLDAALACNAELHRMEAALGQRSRVEALDPIRVRAAEGELALVTGLPPKATSWVAPGDLLLGSWHAGRFQAGAWLPAEASPAFDRYSRP